MAAAGGIAATGPGAGMDGSLRQAGERGAGAGDPRQCPVQQAAHPGELLGDLVLQGPQLVELLLGAGDLVAQLGARALALGGRVGQDRSRLRGRAVHDALGLFALPPLLDAQLGHEDVAPLGDVRGERLLLPGPAVGQLGVEAGPLAVGLFPHLRQPRPALLQPHPQLVLRLVLLGLELAALLAGVVQQFVGLGLGHAEDLRGAAGGAGAHVVHLVLGDAHHLLQAVAHAVHGAGNGGQLSDLGAEALGPGLALGELGAGGPGLAAAHVELARETLQVGEGGLTGGVGSVALGEELAETLLDLRSVETPPNDGEGQAVKIGCHRGERSSGVIKRDALEWRFRLGPGRLHRMGGAHASDRAVGAERIVAAGRQTVNPPIGRSVLLRSDLYYAPSSYGYRLDDHVVGVTTDRPVEAAPAGDEP